MKITLDIDIEKFRYSLVGDGYLYDEVKSMTDTELKEIFKRRINTLIEKEYGRSLPIITDLIIQRRGGTNNDSKTR